LQNRGRASSENWQGPQGPAVKMLADEGGGLEIGHRTGGGSKLAQTRAEGGTKVGVPVLRTSDAAVEQSPPSKYCHVRLLGAGDGGDRNGLVECGEPTAARNHQGEEVKVSQLLMAVDAGGVEKRAIEK
jgi:hypothetical protein